MFFKKKEGYGMKFKDVFSTKEGKRQARINKINKNKKGFIIGVVAGVLALVTAATGIIIHLSRKKAATNNPSNLNPSISISDLGAELTNPEKETTKYSNTTGNIDKNKLAEKNSKIYKDKENADKSNQVGTTVTDTKGGTLKVDSDGKVKETEKGYEIKDKETGKVTQSGNVNKDGKVENFEKNEQTNEVYEKEDEADNLVKADANYYNEEGNCIIHKGDLLSKEALEYAKTNLSTIPSKKVESQTKPETKPETNNTTSSNKGVTNPDGTYTIGGITYLSQADYQQCIIDNYEGYVMIDGIMQPVENLNKNQKVK